MNYQYNVLNREQLLELLEDGWKVHATIGIMGAGIDQIQLTKTQVKGLGSFGLPCAIHEKGRFVTIRNSDV